jgi:hypothetical protein
MVEPDCGILIKEIRWILWKLALVTVTFTNYDIQIKLIYVIADRLHRN